MTRHHNRHHVDPLPAARPLVVADVMTKSVISVSPDAPLSEAVALLADSHVSGLAVVNGHHRVIGVISAQDILTAEAEVIDSEARAKLHETATVRDLMSSPPLTVGPDLPLKEAALEMEYADTHRVFVELDDRLVGVLSRSDVNRAFAQQRK